MPFSFRQRPMRSLGLVRDVLVVDDDPDFLATMEALLSTKGCSVRTARDGAAALEAVRQCVPDAILLDLSMRGMDGYAVARALRQDPRSADIFIAAVSGRGMPSEKAASFAAGIDLHLVKPVAFDDFVDVLLAVRASRSETVPGDLN